MRMPAASMCPYLQRLLQTTVWTYALVGILFGTGALVAFPLCPDQFDYSAVTFPYRLDPRAAGLTPYDPSFTNYTVLLDTHLHTTVTDGRLSPKQVVEWAIASGYNAIFVSDHNTVEGARRVRDVVAQSAAYRDRLLVLPALEYSSCRLHMNLLNIDTNVPLCPGDSDMGHACPNLTDEGIGQMIATVHRMGGWVSVNHIPWSNGQEASYQESRLFQPSLHRLIELGIDAVEVVSQNIFDLPSYRTAKAAGLGTLTGSDMHYPGKPYSWTVLNPMNYTVAGVWAEIMAKRTSFIFDPSGLHHIMPMESQPMITTAYLLLAPLINIGLYLKTFYMSTRGMPSFQGTSCHLQHTKVYGLSLFMYFVFLQLFIVLFTALHDGVGALARRHAASNKVVSVSGRKWSPQ